MNNPYRNRESFEMEVTKRYHFCTRGEYDPMEQAKTALRGVFSKVTATSPHWTMPKDGRHLTGVYAGREFRVDISQQPENDFGGVIRVNIWRNHPTGRGRVNRKLVARIRESLEKCVTYDDG